VVALIDGDGEKGADHYDRIQYVPDIAEVGARMQYQAEIDDLIAEIKRKF